MFVTRPDGTPAWQRGWVLLSGKGAVLRSCSLVLPALGAPEDPAEPERRLAGRRPPPREVTVRFGPALEPSRFGEPVRLRDRPSSSTWPLPSAASAQALAAILFCVSVSSIVFLPVQIQGGRAEQVRQQELAVERAVGLLDLAEPGERSIVWLAGALSSDQRVFLIQLPVGVWERSWAFHSSRRTWSVARLASRHTWNGSQARSAVSGTCSRIAFS